MRSKLRPVSLAVVVCVAVALLVASIPAFALPAGVTKLKGKSRKLPVELDYSATARSVNGFSLDYTCGGKKPKSDSDVYTIGDDGDGSKPLAYAKADGRIRTTLKGQITRFTEDGPTKIGPGKLVLDARASKTATKRVIRGKMRVRSGKCPSAHGLRLRVSGPR